MASQSLPSPPPTPLESESSLARDSNSLSLSEELDTLLERYLSLLDTYTTLRSTLSRDFSSGFFSLAQAQRSSSLGAGRRYGEECYDERMKAGKVVEVTTGASKGSNTESTETAQQPASNDERESERDSEMPHFEIQPIDPPQPEVHQEPQRSDTPSQHPSEASSETRTSTTTKSHTSKPPSTSSTSTPASASTPTPNPTKPTLKPSTPKDPIRQFGILTPPTLRQSQSSFVHAVSNCIPQLVNVSNEMRVLEGEIRTLRKKLESETGCLQEEDGSAQILEKEMTETTRSVGGRSPEIEKVVGGPGGKRTGLVSRTAGPRSRILKLD